MSLQILIAGCLPMERGKIEDVVKKALGQLPESDPWSVSLVKLGDSWSISLDGPEPEVQGLSLTAPQDSLLEILAEAVSSNGSKAGPATHPTPKERKAAEAVSNNGPTAGPATHSTPKERKAAEAASSNGPKAGPATHSTPKERKAAEAVSNNGPKAGPAIYPTLEELEAAEGLLVIPTEAMSEPPAGTAAEKKVPITVAKPDHYDCPSCDQPFKVIYDAPRKERSVRAPIACPHCWQMTKVSVPESAAATEEYRAEALPA